MQILRPIPFALVFLLTVSAGQSAANPSGGSVASGDVTMQNSGNTLNVYSGHRAIINWQDFSIGLDEVTRFIQQGSGSAVLNRVTGPNLSELLGQLLSNGSVFLVNPNGVVVGPNAVIDTASFIASTLNISDQDFLNNRYLFAGDGGSILNQGVIRAGENGSVILISPDIENQGLISSDGGSLMLAAGKSVLVTDIASPEIQFEIQSPADTVTNLGTLISQGGSISVMAGSLYQNGTVSADGIGTDPAGNIVLQASYHAELSADSITSANSAEGTGGNVDVLADYIDLRGSLSATGDSGGGNIHVGGSREGQGPLPNARNTFLHNGGVIDASALGNGDGGTVIVYADGATRIDGAILARGGESGGNGGFVETSGKEWITIGMVPDARAPNGQSGEWLIDPIDLNITATGDNNVTNADTSASSYRSTGTVATLGLDTIYDGLDNFNTVTIQTGSGSTGAGNLNWTGVPEFNYGGISDGVFIKTLNLFAHNNIVMEGSIRDGAAVEAGLNINFKPDSDNNGTGSTILGSFEDQQLDIRGGTLDFSGKPVFVNGEVFIYADTVRAGNITVDSDSEEDFVHLFLEARNFSFNTLSIQETFGSGSVQAEIRQTGGFGGIGVFSGKTLNLRDGTMELFDPDEGRDLDENRNALLSVDTFNWSGGLIDTRGGAGLVRVNKGMNVTANGPRDSLQLTGTELELKSGSTSSWTDATVTASSSQYLKNFGTLSITGNSTFQGGIRLDNFGTLNLGSNATADTILINPDQGIRNGTFENRTGTINIDGNVASDTVSLNEQGGSVGTVSYGTVNVRGSKLIILDNFDNGGTFNLSGGEVNTQAFFRNSDAGDVVPVTGTFNLSGGELHIQGSGFENTTEDEEENVLFAPFNWSGGELNFDNGATMTYDWSEDQFNLTGSGTRTLSGVDTFVMGDPVLNGGTLVIDGNSLNIDANSFTVASGGTLRFDDAASFDPTTFINIGTTRINDGAFNPGSIELRSGSLFQYQSGFGFGNSGTVLSRAGSRLEISGGAMGTGAITLGGTLLMNGGRLNLGGSNLTINRGGLLAVNAPGAYNGEFFESAIGNTATVTNAGTIRVRPGTNESPTHGTNRLTLNGNLANTGTIDVRDSSLSVNGTFNQTAGRIDLQNGELNVGFGGGTLNITGGGFAAGNGADVRATLSLDNATLSPGSSPGSMTVGSLILGPGMTTLIELAGLTQGVTYDFINVTGAANLDGKLVIAPLGGFSPTTGTTFNVIQAGSMAGNFNQVVAPPVGSIYTAAIIGSTVEITATGATGSAGGEEVLTVMDNNLEGGELNNEGAQEVPQEEEQGSPWLDEEAGFQQQLMVCH